VVAGEGLFLEDMEWTPLGVQSARNFEDLSPALHDEKGEVTFLHSVALTPNGCTHGLTFFSAGSVRVGPLRGRNRLIAALEGEHAARIRELGGTVLSERVVRSYSPGQWHAVYDIRIDG